MKRIIISLFFITMFLACIEQYEINISEELPIVVVDGIFTDKLEQQKIFISQSIKLNSQVPVPVSGANVSVVNSLGDVLSFSEMRPGEYEAEGQAKKGYEYRLILDLPDGRNVTSNFQIVPDSFPLLEIATKDTLRTFVNGSGRNERSYSLEFYATAGLDQIKNDMFLRYSANTVYQVLETVCSPFHTVKRCFIYNDQPPQEIDLIEISEQDSGVEINSKVYNRPIDYNLAEVFALDLSLYSYNESEYDYWRKLKLLFDQNGNISDAIPAKVSGNLVTNDGSEVLGLFAVVGKSRKIKLVRNEGFSPTQLPYCGIAGNRPWPLPDECCNCLGLNGAVTDKPDYWP